MRPRLPLLLLTLPILLSAFCSTSRALTPPHMGLPGGWAPIEDIKDPHVREIAVSQHNKQENTHLALTKVMKGESQVVAGTNYRLVLRAKDGRGVSMKYEVVVWEKQWESFRQLMSFHKLVVLSARTPIENISDPHVREIAEFAISEHNDQAKANLTLSQVVKGDMEVVAGSKYRVVLKAKDGSSRKPAKYEGVVWEKTWQKSRQLVSFNLLKR